MTGLNVFQSSSRNLLRNGRMAGRRVPLATAVRTVADVPSVREAERIAALTDPVMRNLSITQSYHELGRGLAVRLGIDASWCALAVWASKQAGQTIRREDPERLLASHLGPELERVVERLVGALEGSSWGRDRTEVRRAIYRALGLRDVLDRSGATIAEGNRKVFAEIGVAMARFMATLAADRVYDEARIRRSSTASGIEPSGWRGRWPIAH